MFLSSAMFQQRNKWYFVRDLSHIQDFGSFVRPGKETGLLSDYGCGPRLLDRIPITLSFGPDRALNFKGPDASGRMFSKSHLCRVLDGGHFGQNMRGGSYGRPRIGGRRIQFNSGIAAWFCAII